MAQMMMVDEGSSKPFFQPNEAKLLEVFEKDIYSLEV